LAPPRRYCIDTSSLIALKRSYPRKSLGPLWDLIEHLASEDRLIAPHEVLRELERVEDEMKAWAKARSGIFVPIDGEQAAAVKEIQVQFPGVSAPDKQLPHADPWCLGLSLVRTRAGDDLYLINEEKDTLTRSDKIPYVARHFKIQWARVLDVPSLEGLEFYLK
jgi:hypothetical protein